MVGSDIPPHAEDSVKGQWDRTGTEELRSQTGKQVLAFLPPCCATANLNKPKLPHLKTTNYECSLLKLNERGIHT